MSESGNCDTDWTVLRRYDGDHLGRIALPLGGIGTGTISFGGRGDFRDCEIMNRPAKGYRGIGLFFCLAYTGDDGVPAGRLLEGPLELSEYEGDRGCTVFNHGLPRFRSCRFDATYPFGRVMLSDADVPVSVGVEAFNPLIPVDTDASGMPVAYVQIALTNTTSRPLDVALCGTLSNIVGTGVLGEEGHQVNHFRSADGLCGLFLDATGVATDAESMGSIALVTPEREGITHRTGWASYSWGDSLLDFWDDFTEDGRLDERDSGGGNEPKASLAVPVHLAAGEERAVTYVLAWHFPNRRTWTPAKEASACCGGDSDIVGNHYCTRYADAWEAAGRALREMAGLRARTVSFVNAFCSSELPDSVKEAALFNTSTLRTQTCFRTRDGRFFGWEGVCDGRGCCHGSCTHVWNYEQATAFLFGSLARSMRETEFALATDDSGLMSFRVNLPVSRAREFGRAAADGQLGCIMKIYRDWQLCGDDALLKRLWPHVRRALEFCWIPGGWDGDRDGVMEGCQHNTMDVEYYGPNPQMQIWYLGALRAAEEMARYLSDGEFADLCRTRFEKGSAWTDANLFNGEYYEHIVQPPEHAEDIAPGLRLNMGAKDLTDPELQLGKGCLVDQLVGQFMAHVCGLGYLVDPDNVRITLESIFRYNFREGFHGHFNHLRSFVLGDESALLMATYPHGERPRRPFPYFNEVMTGFEYTAAVHMLYEGLEETGLRCIAAIRDRYDGRKRSPFDEAECGHHYARAMASWAAVLALTGFRYSAPTGSLTLGAAVGRYFWSSGNAWGTCDVQRGGPGAEVEFRVIEGEIAVGAVSVAGCGTSVPASCRTLRGGDCLAIACDPAGGAGTEAPAGTC